MDAGTYRSVLLCAILSLPSAALPSALATEIVLTSFEPFGGSPVNNSERVMIRLKKLLEASPGALVVKACVLPVEYDRAAKLAFDCSGGVTPDLVLSMGAGGCSLDFETRAKNLDHTYAPDNAGVTRVQSPIVIGGAEFIELNAPMRTLFELSPVNPAFLKVLSVDAGAYVCNNTAYWLAREYAFPGSTTRFGFIHVPPVECGQAADPDTLARTLYEGIRLTFPEIQ